MQAPVRFGGLLRAQLAAVPDDERLGSAGGGLRGEQVHFGAADVGQRPSRVHLGGYSLTVVNEEEMHALSPLPSAL